MPRALLFLLLSLTVGIPLPLAAQQVHRCIGPDGGTLYSDRRCSDLGAAPRIPAAGTSGGSGPRRLPGGCPRTLAALADDLGQAVAAGDVNRLSSLYDWNGLSSSAAGRVLDRLEAIASRPLVDIVPIFPESLPDDVTSSGTADASTPGTGPDDDTRAATPPRPVGLRLEQTLANGSTPSRSVFGIDRRFGCFWLRFGG